METVMGSAKLAAVYHMLFLFQVILFPAYLVDGRTIAGNDERIAGGRYALPGEFPYQVSIGYINPETNTYAHLCGGSILDKHHVLTAAYCGEVFENGEQEWIVVAGALNLTDLTEKNRVELPVVQVYVHENFTYANYRNDITLIRVDGEFPLDGKFISTIPLRNVTLNPPAECTVSGWGIFSSEMKISEVLKELDLPVVPQEDCVKSYEDAPLHIFPGMLCTGSVGGGPSPCLEDTGGPLVCEGQLTGVFSWSILCYDAFAPSVNTDVAYYKDWIQETLAKSIKDGGL
ncbi:trypsin-like [Anabrus simplex]|uniref:trypsin-like n=1 Tax=Anabrus simplex TaxID=316456 RepID=UPI0035A312D3